MYNILTANKIAKIGLDRFGANYSISDATENPDAIVLRSASLHEMFFPDSLKAIARAGAGVNNIPIDRCAEQGIVVFNTPGANANAVKELVITALFLASRKITTGIEWAKTLKGNGANVGKLVEKGKGSFVGPEIKGKKLGVIGLGAIGVMVANAAQALGMDVIGFDPYLSVDAAWHLSRAINKAQTAKEIYETCDYITIHVPFMDSTRDYIGADEIAIMKDGVRILNFARGELVNSTAIIEAVKSGKVASYVTDFPNDDQLCVENIIAIPHLGASTPESEDNCACMAVDEVKQFLEYGVIVNSVNFPTISEMPSSPARICVIHRNIPNMLSQISTIVSGAGVNIDNLANKSKNEYSYTVLDISADVADSVMEEIKKIDGVLRTWKLVF